ncbi:MAG: DUF368 domain-containing protein [Acidimicrobiales bacterium]
MAKHLLQFLRGFFMGSADIVPGVSGGTVALILGIYKDLIHNVRGGAHALKRLVTGDPGGFVDDFRTIDWLFLIPLGAGIAGAFLVLRHPMETLLVDHAEGTAAVFAGLVLASCLLVWQQLTVRDALRMGVLAFVTVAAFVLLGFQSGAITDAPIWMFFVTGAIAICAMILPGISGSFIMLMLGMYAGVITGAPVELLVFLVGAVIGLAGFSSFLNWLLEHHEQTVLAALLGLMLGSFRVLWPWPNGVGVVSEEQASVVKGTALHLPDAGQAIGGVALAAAAFVVTMLIVRFADADQESIGDELAPAPHNA